MSFSETLLWLFVFPTLFAVVFPGNSNADRSVKRLLNNYPYYILLSEKTRINSLLFKLFSKDKNNKRPFIYYTKIGYIVLAVLQIPMAIILYTLEVNIFTLYFWILLVVCLIPYIIVVIATCVLERKEKLYKKGIRRIDH